MLIECPTCSQSGGERSNPQVEARGGEPTSRNASELVSASLHEKTGVANLSDVLKPATVGEVTFTCSQLAPRGDWRQRVGTERLRNLGGPQPMVVVSVRESDGLIVVRKQGNSCGAKGTDCECELHEFSELRLPSAITELNSLIFIQLRIKRGTAHRRAGCGKSARPVR